MTTDREINKITESILIPGAGRSLEKFNLVRKATIDGGRIKLSIANTGLDDTAKEWLAEQLSQQLCKLPEVSNVTVEFVDTKPIELNRVRNIVAVMSGKGGVGKSLVTALLAIECNRRSMDVGILDADITGPTIPYMFGVSQRPAASEDGIFPVLSSSGISIMSMNLVLPHEDDPVRWRGPVIAGTIREFWEHVIWGNLDLLLVDLPPGTSDAALTVIEKLPLSGTIIVSTPQSLVGTIVRKSISLNKKMNIPILGLVENMSYLISDDDEKGNQLLGRSRGVELASAAGSSFLGQIPLDPELARICDEGTIESYGSPIIESLGRGLTEALKL
ncbi:P-loop NTPase [Chloroflexota bacterium]